MSDKLEKINFLLGDEPWHGLEIEGMWGAPLLGSKYGDNVYMLDNSPFYFVGVSYKDIVKCNIVDGIPQFEKVVERGGHSTYMIMHDINCEEAEIIKKKIQENGCKFESTRHFFDGKSKKLISLDVPPEANLKYIIDLLYSGENRGAWIFQEGYTFLRE